MIPGILSSTFRVHAHTDAWRRRRRRRWWWRRRRRRMRRGFKSGECLLQ
jgi:hypothetical protein